MSSADHQCRRKHIQHWIKSKRCRQIAVQQMMHAPQRTAARAIKARYLMKKTAWINPVTLRRKQVQHNKSTDSRDCRDPFPMLQPALHDTQLRASNGKLNPKMQWAQTSRMFGVYPILTVGAQF
jgi:hypothetical protein